MLFATHHLAEADEIADRVVVLNHGKVVADGPGATLKAAVATRRLRFVTDRPDRAELSELDGVTEVERLRHRRLDRLAGCRRHHPRSGRPWRPVP